MIIGLFRYRDLFLKTIMNEINKHFNTLPRTLKHKSKSKFDYFLNLHLNVHCPSEHILAFFPIFIGNVELERTQNTGFELT